MKRTMIATALTTTLATSAFALTDAQIDEITTFAPEVNVAAMTETELDLAYDIIYSGDSRSAKLAALRALTVDKAADGVAMLSEAEMLRLERFAPGVDLSTVSQAQAELALSVSYGSESVSAKSQRIQTILTDTNMTGEMMNAASAAELALIERYAPEVNVEALSEEDVQLILTYIHGGGSYSEKLSKIESIVGS